MSDIRRFQILGVDGAQRAIWLSLWEEWPNREVFAHPGYLELFADPVSKPRCAVYSSPDGVIFYPFLLRDLGAEAFVPDDLKPLADMISPYGYGGIFFWGTPSPQVIAAFWEALAAWAGENRVISEFIRFSLFSEFLLPYPGERLYKQKNIVRDLLPPVEAIWADVEHKVRKNVNKATRSGIEIKVVQNEEYLDEFIRIYQHTMSRRSAGALYYFQRSFFESIIETLSGQFMFFHALHEGKVVSTELVLVSADTAYSFLGGTDADSFDLRPNDLLKFEIIKWARQAGKKRFVLGGGYVSGDGIYRFKASFAPGGEYDFWVGKRIFSPDIYRALVEKKRHHFISLGKEFPQNSEFFPLYRISPE